MVFQLAFSPRDSFVTCVFSFYFSTSRRVVKEQEEDARLATTRTTPVRARLRRRNGRVARATGSARLNRGASDAPKVNASRKAKVHAHTLTHESVTHTRRSTRGYLQQVNLFQPLRTGYKEGLNTVHMHACRMDIFIKLIQP